MAYLDQSSVIEGEAPYLEQGQPVTYGSAPFVAGGSLSATGGKVKPGGTQFVNIQEYLKGNPNDVTTSKLVRSDTERQLGDVERGLVSALEAPGDPQAAARTASQAVIQASGLGGSPNVSTGETTTPQIQSQGIGIPQTLSQVNYLAPQSFMDLRNFLSKPTQSADFAQYLQGATQRGFGAPITGGEARLQRAFAYSDPNLEAQKAKSVRQVTGLQNEIDRSLTNRNQAIGQANAAIMEAQRYLPLAQQYKAQDYKTEREFQDYKARENDLLNYLRGQGVSAQARVNPFVSQRQNIESQIASLEGNLQNVLASSGPESPQYRQIANQIQQLRNQLGALAG